MVTAILVTRATGTNSTAPADALATTEVTEAARRRGMITPCAPAASAERISSHGLSNRVTLFHQGHENLGHCIPQEENEKITGAIFNLGYLPGSDKSIVTKPNTTISAVEQLLTIMASEGIIILVILYI